MNEPFNRLILVEAYVPFKFAPWPTMRVQGLNGEEGLAADRGMGMITPDFDLTDKSLKALMEYEKHRLDCFPGRAEHPDFN